jgi:molybdopterin/thiamine biosynthesis adenylyltransferase
MSVTDLDYSGQKDFYDPQRHRGSVTVIGAGGIGSPTIMGLARLGVPSISIYDDDVVEPRNVTAQNFRIQDIGKPKVSAIADQASEVTMATLRTKQDRVSPDSRLFGEIIVSAVDSMKSRKDIYEAAKNSPTARYLIDGRLGGELIVCHTIDIRNPEHVEYYLSDDVMFDDSQMESNVCTARAICDVGFAVAALITRNVRRILIGDEPERVQMLNMKTLRLDTF